MKVCNKKGGVALVFSVLLVVVLSSCGEYSKLLKSKDVQKKYDYAIQYYNAKKYSKAITLFEMVLPNFTGTTKEDTILFFNGMAYFKTNQYEVAEQYMNQYRMRFSRSGFTEQAEYHYAMSIYNQTLDTERDQSFTRRAISAFNEYLNRYPESQHTVEINSIINELQFRLYEKAYLNAALYYKIGQYNSAIVSLKATLKDYPETPQAEDILYLITKSWFSYAENSILSKQLDRYIKTIDSYYNFASQFPKSEKYGKEMERMYEVSRNFTDKNGVKAQQAAKNLSVIEANKLMIEQNREKIFEATTKEERAKLREQIKKAKAEIRNEKQQLKNNSVKTIESRPVVKKDMQ